MNSVAIVSGCLSMLESADSVLLSVIIITRNRPKTLANCLNHLLSQEGQPFEVIVVDASDNDETQHLMTDYPQVHYVRLHNAANQMPRSRNKGLKVAQGEIVAFIDDDSLVQPGWLRALVRHYADPKVGGVGGLVLAPDEEPRQDGVVGDMSPLGTPLGDFNVQIPGPVRVEHLRGCNMSFRREVLVSLGGFDSRYDGSNFREDTDMSVRVRRAGYGLVYDPKVFVIHLYVRKEAYDRDDRADRAYRFSVAKNTAYFRLKHFLSLPTFLSLLIVGPTRVLYEVLRGRQSLALARADLRGRWAGVKTYLTTRWGSHNG